MFSSLEQNIFYFRVKPIDKDKTLCLNDFIIWIKTLTENLFFQILLQRAGGWCEPEHTYIKDLVPELVL